MIDAFAPALAALAERIEPGAALVRAWRLHGGISAQTLAFEMQRDDGTMERYVARCLPTEDDLRHDLDATGKFRLLCALYDAGVPVPRPLLHEPWNEQLQSAVIVLAFVDGDFVIDHRDVPTLMCAFAGQLAMIHGLDRRALGLSFLPDRSATWTRRLQPRPENLDGSLEEGAIRDVLDAVWPIAPRNAPVLLHGDFWPGNVLWHDDKLAAIIDWEDAAIGDPLSDVAITRLELLWRFDMAAANAFTEHYQSLTGIDSTDLPLWDLLVALRPAGVIGTWSETPGFETRMRARHRKFVRQAAESIALRAKV